MKTYYLIVEGQTEEQFAEKLLAPLAHQNDIHLEVLLPRTGVTASGKSAYGGGSWKHMVRLARGLLRNPGAGKIGVMFDVYGSEFQRVHSEKTGHELHCAIKQSAEESITSDDEELKRLYVGPVLYEFETLVIAGLATGKTRERKALEKEALATISRANGDVEMVNGAVATSPSHRVANWWGKHLKSRYEKVVDGPRVLNSVDWSDIEQACPTFARWVEDFLS